MSLARRSNGLTIKHREAVTNPHSARCALHLRRVCGVCENFSGDLRGGGQCNLFKVGLAGRRDARGCERWSRKIAKG